MRIFTKLGVKQMIASGLSSSGLISFVFHPKFLVGLLMSGLLVSFLMAGGCTKKKDDGVPFTTVYANTIGTTCTECHVPGGAATSDGVQLDFTTQVTAYATLTTLNTTGASSTGICGGVKIVTASSVENSYLAGVLIEGYHTNNFAGVSGCLPYSAHLTDQSLTDAEKSAIVSWIQHGALNN